MSATIVRMKGVTEHAVGHFDSDGFPVADVSIEKPCRLSIVSENGSIYLYRFNKSGECIADTWHLTLEEAKSQAEFEFVLDEEGWHPPSEKLQTLPWWCEIDVRITGVNLDPVNVTRLLDFQPAIALASGKSKIHYRDSTSAGYWCAVHRVNHPERPSSAISWVERFLALRESAIKQLLNQDCAVVVYLGIHTNVMLVGFELPPTPIMNLLQIPIGIEFYSR